MAQIDELKEKLNKATLEDKPSPSTPLSDDDSNVLKWGIILKELYRMGLTFYKEQSGKALSISYEDNCKLVAFTQQVSHGPLSTSKVPPLGYLDVVGRDRRVAWQHLGNITKYQAMEGFIDLLDRLTPLFRPYVEAIKKDKEEKLKIEIEQQKVQRDMMEKENARLAEEKRLQDQKYLEEMQKRQLQDALNEQTFHQFKAYAEKQYPGNPEQQALLIRQLQNEHYHQYMQQLQSQMKFNNETVINDTTASFQQTNPTVVEGTEVKEDMMKNQYDSDNDSGEGEELKPANLWSRPNIKEFKKEISAGRGDGVIVVDHGDVVTVRVPTHEGGNCLFWEFATDNYDIGFGVYFEWGPPNTTEVTVHISESDEEDDTLEDDEAISAVEDLESGPLNTQILSDGPLTKDRPPISVIVPIYRRECQNEVYAGSHVYPGHGTYLLKFDNSYSLWRSKTLYYRVFYTR